MITNDCTKITEKAKVERNGAIMKWTHMDFNLLQRTKKFPPKKKNTPKSHSLSHAKTSELPPTAEHHFVVN